MIVAIILQFMTTLIHVVLVDGSIRAEDPKSPVPNDILAEVSHLLTEDVSFEDAVDRLRCRTVPSGHCFHTWREGMYMYAANECLYYV